MPTPPESAPGQPTPAHRGTRITPLQWLGLGVLLVLLLDQMGFIRLLSPGGLGFGGALEELPSLVALVLAITVHEFSHGFIATAFGDTTPRRAGRLTLNPLKHLDPIGTLMILLRAPIGWGRPMPINPAEMRNPSLGWALSSIAGPVSNVLAASVCVLAFSALGGLDRNVAPYVNAFIQINVLLAVFNLVPIPPLDGFGFVMGLSPRSLKLALAPVYQYGPFILMAVLFIPGLRSILGSYLNVGAGVVFSFLGLLSSAI